MPLPEASDLDLMRRIRQRDETALEALYDRYAPRLLGLATQMLGQTALAEEILQEAFFRVWERAETFDPLRGQLAVWLVAVLRNLCRDALRQQKARPMTVESALSLPEESQWANLPDPLSDVPATASARARRERVRRALAQLPEDQRQVVELSFFGGLTRREIAAQLKDPEGTVHTRARLALQKLRSLLQDEEP